MASPHSSIDTYHAAIPEIRHAVRHLDGHLARRALAQVLAELIVEGAPHETPQCADNRRHFAEAHLQEEMEELRRLEGYAGP